jgi:probable F420-dependent oxidoreductase
MAGPLAGAASIRDLAQAAEDLNFDSVWVADHIVIPHRVTSSYPYDAGGDSPFDPGQPFYEPLSVLNFLAGCTERIRIGTHVLIIPYRNPLFTAKILATIDVLSGGRLTLGAGVGWMEEEFHALGLDSYHERGAITDEYLRLFKELWVAEQPEFQGKYFQVSAVGFAPKPVQRPHPPIWTGGHSDRALKRAAVLADGWMPIGLRPPTLLQPKEFGEKLARLRTLIHQAGRSQADVTVSFTAPISFTRAPAESRRLLTGDPEQIADDMRQYRSLGVENFNLNLPGNSIREQQASMERFASDVMPLISTA